MARSIFGGDIAQLIVAPDTGDGTNHLEVAPGVTVPLYDAVGGSLATDFLLWDQATDTFPTAASSIVSLASGYLPRFQGPDGITTLFFLAPDGKWMRLRSETSGGGAVTSVLGLTGAVTFTADAVTDGTTGKQFTATERTKLSGISTSATANDTDANLKNRVNHTGVEGVDAMPITVPLRILSQVTTGFWPATYNADGSVATYGASQTTGVRPTSRACSVEWLQVVPGGLFPASVASGTAGPRQGLDVELTVG